MNCTNAIQKGKSCILNLQKWWYSRNDTECIRWRWILRFCYRLKTKTLTGAEGQIFLAGFLAGTFKSPVHASKQCTTCLLNTSCLIILCSSHSIHLCLQSVFLILTLKWWILSLTLPNVASLKIDCLEQIPNMSPLQLQKL